MSYMFLMSSFMELKSYSSTTYVLVVCLTFMLLLTPFICCGIINTQCPSPASEALTSKGWPILLGLSGEVELIPFALPLPPC